MSASFSSLARRAAMTAADRTGCNVLLRRAWRKRLAIACYHGVVPGEHPDDPAYRNTVSLREFRRQMELLARWFHPVSAADVAAWLEDAKQLPDRPVMVTFDDGFRNNLEHAAPVLRRLGIPALIHVATGYVGSTRPLWAEEVRLRICAWPEPVVPMPGSLPDVPAPADTDARVELADRVRGLCKHLPGPEARTYLERLRSAPLPAADAQQADDLLAFLSWDDVRTLRDQGFDIGSHTVGHPILSRCNGAELARELAKSKAAIERETGRECSAIAYPNGGRNDFDERVIAGARAAGYRLGFTMTSEWNSRGASALALSRIHIVGHMPEVIFRYRMSGLYTVVERAR
jgi:peptidoglycan/xylan/chitin deacetylase (PgdA/CDA1 family)